MMIYAPCLEQWSEDMNSALTPVLKLLGERMKHLDINASKGFGEVGIYMSDISALEYKWEGQLN